MRAVVICGGAVGDYILDYLDGADIIVCADSGYDRAKEFGIKPDIIIGDMDSVEADFSSLEIKKYPSKKDFTDSELAIRYAIENGCDELLLFGMTGSRMDHTFANLSLLASLDGVFAKIIDSNNIIYILKDKITIKATVGDIISILPFSGDIHGVTTQGLYYALSDATIKFGTTLGVSNVMTSPECSIEIKDGTALVIRSRD